MAGCGGAARAGFPVRCDPANHHRRSLRLDDYDYTQANAYFVTLMVQSRYNVFARAAGGTVVLNEAGRALEAIGHALVIGAFRSLSTRRYMAGVQNDGWPPFDGRLWQRNCYERIVRDEHNLNRVCAYIEQNPAKWLRDRDLYDV